MLLCSLGHLSFYIESGHSRLLVNPYCSTVADVGPIPQVNYSDLPLPTNVVVSSRDCLTLNVSSINQSCRQLLLTCRGATSRIRQSGLALSSIRELDGRPWKLADDLVVWMPFSEDGSGIGVVISSDDAVLWVYPGGALSSRILEEIRNLAGKRPVVIAVSSYLDLPRAVARGESRAFPVFKYRCLLDNLRQSVSQLGATLAISSGIGFRGRAAWLNDYAAPVAMHTMVSDCELCTKSVCAFESGRWYTINRSGCIPEMRPSVRCMDSYGPPRFDPTLGVPDFVGAGDISTRSIIVAAGSNDLLKRYGESIHYWNVRVGLIEVGARESRSTTVDLASPHREMVSGLRWPNLIFKVTGTGFQSIKSHSQSFDELLLTGHLRLAERIYHTERGSVTVPVWEDWPKVRRGHCDGRLRLPNPATIFERLFLEGSEGTAG